MDNTILKNTNWFQSQLNTYQSANNDYEFVKKNFVIREQEFSTIINSLKDKADKDPLQHELILGRRGSGKSTLLKRIEVEIIEDKKLKENYIPINLAEEQAGIYRLFDLWEQVIEELECYLKTNIPKTDFFEFNSEQDYTHSLYEIVHQTCKKYKKKIVLLLDNFDRIVENFTDDGNLLRETLVNYNDIQIIGGSTRMDEHFWRYDKPFYEFFRRHRLEGLNREETYKLLHHWSNLLQVAELETFIKKNPGKIENIRILTDGLPRTIQIFIQIVLQNTQSEVYEYLKKIMDSVTPLYQERLNNLTAPLRKIVLEMSFIWESCTTKQLAEKTKMESKLISAHLKSLTEKGIVEKIETNTKNHLYRISERFFNIWLIITQGNPEQKRRAKWMSIFLENFYDVDDFRFLIQTHLSLLQSKQLNYKEALVFSKALSQSKYTTTQERDKIIELTESLNESNTEYSFIKMPKKFEDIFKESEVFINNGNYDKALKLVEEFENEEDGMKFLLLGSINYYFNKNYKNAKINYKKAIEKGNIDAISNLAVLYSDKEKNLFKAEKYFKKSYKHNKVDGAYNLGLLYQKQNNFIEAEKYYLIAIKNKNYFALFNLALLYDENNKFDKAEKYYLMAINNNNYNAISNLANLYDKQGDFEKAEKYYLLAIDKNNDEIALNNLSIRYYEKNINKKKALEYLKKAMKLNSTNLLQQKLIILEVWNGILNNLENKIFNTIKSAEKSMLERFFLELLTHQQKNLALKFFLNDDFGEELQEKYSVLFYVCQLLNNGEKGPNLKLKIPPELQDTVTEMLSRIEEGQKFYGYI